MATGIRVRNQPQWPRICRRPLDAERKVGDGGWPCSYWFLRFAKIRARFCWKDPLKNKFRDHGASIGSESFLPSFHCPTIASVSLAEYSFSSHKPSRIRRTLRLGFLGMKVALILSVAYFSSVDLAYWHSPAFAPSGAYIQLIASFAICLFGMRWALLDQRQALPCLPQARDASCASRTGVENVPRLERNGAYLHKWTYASSRPRACPRVGSARSDGCTWIHHGISYLRVKRWHSE